MTRVLVVQQPFGLFPFEPLDSTAQKKSTRPNMDSSTFFFLLLSSPLLTAATNTSSSTLTAYEVLSSYNFPIGLLPQGALGYDLDTSTGKFAAYLSGECMFTLEGSYELRYKSTIKGYISNNRLSSLEGVSVKILLFWMNIVEVTRVEDELQFSVGIASANFPISNFDVCPQCGRGIDCVNLEERGGVKLRAGF